MLKNKVRVSFCRIKTAAQSVLGLTILTVAVVAAVITLLNRTFSAAKRTVVTKGTVYSLCSHFVDHLLSVHS
jgi:hypothetical protein